MAKSQKRDKKIKKERRKPVAKAKDKDKTSLTVVKSQGSAQESQNASQAIQGEAVGAGNVDKIRDILFGNQMKDYGDSKNAFL